MYFSHNYMKSGGTLKKKEKLNKTFYLYVLQIFYISYIYIYISQITTRGFNLPISI